MRTSTMNPVKTLLRPLVTSALVALVTLVVPVAQAQDLRTLNEGLTAYNDGKYKQAALVFFDRAAVADPSDPDPKLQAARALIADGRRDLAAERLHITLN